MPNQPWKPSYRATLGVQRGEDYAALFTPNTPLPLRRHSPGEPWSERDRTPLPTRVLLEVVAKRLAPKAKRYTSPTILRIPSTIVAAADLRAQAACERSEKAQLALPWLKTGEGEHSVLHCPKEGGTHRACGETGSGAHMDRDGTACEVRAAEVGSRPSGGAESLCGCNPTIALDPVNVDKHSRYPAGMAVVAVTIGGKTEGLEAHDSGACTPRAAWMRVRLDQMNMAMAETTVDLIRGAMTGKGLGVMVDPSICADLEAAPVRAPMSCLRYRGADPTCALTVTGHQTTSWQTVIPMSSEPRRAPRRHLCE